MNSSKVKEAANKFGWESASFFFAIHGPIKNTSISCPRKSFKNPACVNAGEAMGTIFFANSGL